MKFVQAALPRCRFIFLSSILTLRCLRALRGAFEFRILIEFLTNDPSQRKGRISMRRIISREANFFAAKHTQ